MRGIQGNQKVWVLRGERKGKICIVTFKWSETADVWVGSPAAIAPLYMHLLHMQQYMSRGKEPERDKKLEF